MYSVLMIQKGSAIVPMKDFLFKIIFHQDQRCKKRVNAEYLIISCSKVILHHRICPTEDVRITERYNRLFF